MPDVRLSLVMIVRDQRALLADCLAAHRGLADEVVVVDTGSSDGSAATAAAAGARVGRHVWRDDFAAARNAGLDLARGRWILILDADERIDPRDAPTVRAAACRPPDRAYLQETRNYLPHRRHAEWRPLTGEYPDQERGCGWFAARRVGLFPRRDDVRFAGRVHESVLPALAACGLPLDRLPAVVHHHGHLLGATAATARRRRDLRLLSRQVADVPGEPGPAVALACALLEEGRREDANPLLHAAAAQTDVTRPVTRARVLLGRLARADGDGAAAEAWLARAVAGEPGFLFARLEWLRLLAEHRRWDALSGGLRAARGAGLDHPDLDRLGGLVPALSWPSRSRRAGR
ncbi:MAG: glycosyltransferase family 2 protein [Candidatus Krumholzibacteriia bacterium]